MLRLRSKSTGAGPVDRVFRTRSKAPCVTAKIRSSFFVSDEPVHAVFQCAQRDAGAAGLGLAPRWLARCSEQALAPAACTCVRMSLPDLTLLLAVSNNEEYVHLSLRCGALEIDLGARTHNYLLLELARRRVRGAREGFSGGHEGWVDLQDWARDPTLSPPRLNVDVFRIRRHFADHGVGGAPGIIERRVREKQIRLGVGRVEIRRV